MGALSMMRYPLPITPHDLDHFMQQIHATAQNAVYRSGTPAEQAAADAALAMAAGVVADLGGKFTSDGTSGPGTAGAWSYGYAELNGKTVRLSASGGGVVQVNRHPFDPVGKVILSAEQVKFSILKVAPAPDASDIAAKAAGRALEQSYPFGYRSADSAP